MECREKKRQKNPDFWDVKKYLPGATQTYVINFITLNMLFNNYDNFIKNRLNFTPLEILIPGNFERTVYKSRGKPSAVCIKHNNTWCKLIPVYLGRVF